VGSDAEKIEACEAALALACGDFARNAFGKGFQTVNAALDAMAEHVDAPVPAGAGAGAGAGEGALAPLLSQLWALRGAEHILMRRWARFHCP